MNLKSLSDPQLEIETLAAAKNEQHATLLLLDYLAEVDARMLYAKRGYSSLWQYVHRELKYSESQTTERVSSMRLMRRMPEVKTAVENQSLSLTSTAKIASFMRREKPCEETALKLILNCQGKSTREVESILLSESSLPAHSKPELIKPVSIEITRISFDADAEMMQMIALIREQNIDLNLSVKDALKIALTEKVVQLQKRLRAPEVKRSSVNLVKPAKSAKVILATVSGATSLEASNSDFASNTSTTSKPSSRYISKHIRAKIYARASFCHDSSVALDRLKPQCEYVDAKTLKRCDGVKALQCDHILPFAQGGRSTVSNLQLLCANHNRLRVPSALRFESKRRY